MDHLIMRGSSASLNFGIHVALEKDLAAEFYLLYVFDPSNQAMVAV